MKKLVLVTASVLALALAAPSVSQEITSSEEITEGRGVSVYYVKEGDNLWRLSEVRLGDPEKWRYLVEMNPILAQPSRNYNLANGTPAVRIFPGEALYGLAEIGISVSPAAPSSNAIDYTPTVVAESPLEDSNDWNWPWWLLLIPGAAFLWWLFQRRESQKDPVYSGTPQVPGGISSVEQAHERFASSQGFRQRFDVINTIPGFISGTMMVRYGDGKMKPRVLNRQRAFQATIRLENGQTENVYMLQQCGNDLKFGGISRYLPGPDFCFEPDPVSAPMPEPEPAPAVAPLPSEEAEPLAVSEDVVSDNRPELKIELKPAENEGDAAMVRITGAPTEDMVVTIGEDSFTLRFHPNKR